MSNKTDLKAIPLTQEDISLITFALRKLAKSTVFGQIQMGAKDLIEYIEKENKYHDNDNGSDL